MPKRQQARIDKTAPGLTSVPPGGAKNEAVFTYEPGRATFPVERSAASGGKKPGTAWILWWGRHEWWANGIMVVFFPFSLLFLLGMLVTGRLGGRR